MNDNIAEISVYYSDNPRGKWNDCSFESIEEAEDYVAGWIMFSEDNYWRYYQQGSNHAVATWIRIKKIKEVD